MSKRIPKLERAVRNFSQLFGVRIEPCCLNKHRIGIDESIYIVNGLIVSNLTLKNLPEPDAIQVLPFFRKLKHFAMEDMKIVEDMEISRFPANLTELTLINCKIEEDLILQWFYTFDTTLRRLHWENVDPFFHHTEVDKRISPYTDLYMFRNLQSLTVISQFWNLEIFSDTLEFLVIISDSYDDLRASTLKYFHCDVAYRGFRTVDVPLPTLKFLTLRKWETLQSDEFPSLEEVEILSEVDPKHKAEIESAALEVLVKYRPIPQPVEVEVVEPNLIFEMLNYDCLLEITNYLSTTEDWMQFGRLHENAEMVVASYKFPRDRLSSQGFLKTGIYAEDQDYFNRVSKLVQNLWVYQDSKFDIDWRHFIRAFENVSTLSLRNLTTDLFDSLPSGLVNLDVAVSILNEPSSAAYLRKLNSTLRILTVSSSFPWVTLKDDQLQCLAELHNLQEFVSNVAVPPGSLAILLDRNRCSLERVELIFLTDEENGWTPHGDVLRLMSTTTNLKELRIQKRGESSNDRGLDVKLLAMLLTSVGSNLKTLNLTGDFVDNEIRQILNNDCLKSLQKLKVQLYRDEELGTMFSQLTGLRTLQIVSDCYIRQPLLLEQKFGDFFEFLNSLPKLEELHVPQARSYKFEIELREFFKRTYRALQFKSYGELKNFYIFY